MAAGLGLAASRFGAACCVFLLLASVLQAASCEIRPRSDLGGFGRDAHVKFTVGPRYATRGVRQATESH